MQITITHIHRSDKDKSGKAYVSKSGKPYTRLGLKTKEHGDKWLSGFDNFTTAKWAVGDTVEIEVEKVAGKDGKEYLNFHMESENDKIWKMMTYLQSQINELKKNYAHLASNFGEVPDEEIGKVNSDLSLTASEAKDLEDNLPF